MAIEDVGARFQDLDAWGDLDILKALYEGQLAAVAAIATSLPAIAEVVAAAVPWLEAGGRLIYAGAGTCGLEAATRHLDRARGDVKRAALLASGADAALAETLLTRHRGNLRLALVDLGAGPSAVAPARPRAAP